MNTRRKPRSLDSIEEFERALEMEISLAEQYGPPLSVITMRSETERFLEDIRRVLDTVRLADSIARSGPSEVSIILPNTGSEDTRRVEERLREAMPGAVTGFAEHEAGDTAEDLLDRARYNHPR